METDVTLQTPTLGPQRSQHAIVFTVRTAGFPCRHPFPDYPPTHTSLGVLFYGNATLLGVEVDEILRAKLEGVGERGGGRGRGGGGGGEGSGCGEGGGGGGDLTPVRGGGGGAVGLGTRLNSRHYILLDFTLVSSIDASAVS